MDPLVEENCSPYAGKNSRPNFGNQVSLYGKFKPDFTDAHECKQTLKWDDVPINLPLRLLTTPDCINNIT